MSSIPPLPVVPTSLIIKFGKNKGRTIQELIIDDPKYILWLTKQKWLSPDLLQEIKERIPQMILPFGRHQGFTMSAIQDEDPSYYTWLLKDTRLQIV
jgi:uncharacterized protein (DUF3820 family)